MPVQPDHAKGCPFFGHGMRKTRTAVPIAADPIDSPMRRGTRNAAADRRTANLLGNGNPVLPGRDHRSMLRLGGRLLSTRPLPAFGRRTLRSSNSIQELGRERTVCQTRHTEKSRSCWWGEVSPCEDGDL